LTSPPPDRLRTTGAGLLAGWALTGLVLGRLLRPVVSELDLTAPRVGWVQALALYLVAAILAAVAWTTRRALQPDKERLRARALLEPHQAVNRLVLAKACALAGALVCGGYVGHALSWVGAEAELGSERIVRSLVAAAGAALTVVASLLLERACRIREDEDET
jgi:MFS family permease